MATLPKTYSDLLRRIRSEATVTAQAELERYGLLHLLVGFDFYAARHQEAYAFCATHGGVVIGVAILRDADPEDFDIDGWTAGMDEVCRCFAGRIIKRIAEALIEQAEELYHRGHWISSD